MTQISLYFQMFHVRYCLPMPTYKYIIILKGSGYINGFVAYWIISLIFYFSVLCCFLIFFFFSNKDLFGRSCPQFAQEWNWWGEVFWLVYLLRDVVCVFLYPQSVNYSLDWDPSPGEGLDYLGRGLVSYFLFPSRHLISHLDMVYLCSIDKCHLFWMLVVIFFFFLFLASFSVSLV